jgi:hypothetical protein
MFEENMEKSISIAEFRRTINRLPSDEPKVRPGIWYLTQKQHWLGWLRGYDGPGAYGRKNWTNRDAKFVYNHVVCPGLLIYLIVAAKLKPEVIEAAKQADVNGTTLMGKVGAIRKIAPWPEIYTALWGTPRKSWYKRIWSNET